MIYIDVITSVKIIQVLRISISVIFSVEILQVAMISTLGMEISAELIISLVLISMYLILNMNDPAQVKQVAWYIFLKNSTPDQECSCKWKFSRMVCIFQVKIEQQVL